MAEGKGGALRELVAFLGFDLDEKGIDRADRRIEETKKRAEMLTGALEAVGIALGLHEVAEFIEGQIEMGAAVERTSQQMGIGVEDLQAFQYAAATVGVGTDEANAALGHLNRTLGEARTGNAEAIKSLTHLGLTMEDIKSNDLPSTIAKVAEGFRKLPGAAERNAASMKVLGRAAGPLINLLAKGGDSVEALTREFEELGGGLSEDFIATAAETEHAMVKLKTAQKGLSSEIGSVLLPYVADFAQGAAGLIVKLRDWSKESHFLRNALITLAAIAGILVLTWGILNIEILLVIAALALLALAVDDVITFFEDGDSVLGRFLDRLYGIGASKDIAQKLRDAWKEVADAFGKLWDAVKDLGPTLKDLFDTFTKQGSDGTAKNTIQSIADATKGLVDHLTNAVTWLDTLLKKFDNFAKAHPLLVHAVERSAHQLAKGNFGVGGALSAVGGDVLEAVTGDTSIGSYTDQKDPTPQTTAGYSVRAGNSLDDFGARAVTHNQHLETKIVINGVAGADEATGKLKDAVRDGARDANNSAFYAVGGGASP